ncbi:MAG: hypothetical protein IKO27_07765 [Ruminococcus sp.]|nr:hypothetical protein [Ruminococcus sp.]
MLINVEHPIISYSDKGKPFQYEKLFYATVEPYILEFKNCRLDKLTDEDAARCLARIFNKMEVNSVPVTEFFKADIDKMKAAGKSQYEITTTLASMIAHDIFCCFDKNLYDENDEFAVCDRIYCIVKDGEKDFIYCNSTVKEGKLARKHPSPEAVYFAELMKFNEQGKLPKVNDN